MRPREDRYIWLNKNQADRALWRLAKGAVLFPRIGGTTPKELSNVMRHFLYLQCPIHFRIMPINNTSTTKSNKLNFLLLPRLKTYRSPSRNIQAHPIRLTPLKL